MKLIAEPLIPDERVSLPTRERELKPRDAPARLAQRESLPTRERELKLQSCTQTEIAQRSLPTRERELKLVGGLRPATAAGVAPYTGA